MGPSTGLMTAPLSFLRDKDSYLEVEDDDVGLNQLMGRCSLNPTDEELAKGIFVAKDCFSEAMEGTLEGKGNILELKIRIQVESH